MPDSLTTFAYQTFQTGKSIFSFTHKSLATEFIKRLSPGVEGTQENPRMGEVIKEVRRAYDRIIQQDLADVDQGIYPASLLFDNPWEDFFRFYPQVWLDMPGTWQRAKDGKFRDFAPNIDLAGYPNYYTQNFHHQTGGYLSEDSANLYDLQVELLFFGAADAMRRRVLAPLRKGLGKFADLEPKSVRVLDVACGTGRTLRMLRGALPKASLYGIDLSPTYLRKANSDLSKLPGELPQLSQANGEDLPYRDHYFHGLSCVFLFHELPGPVRQKVIDECFRVLQPGGTLVICDSIQLVDSPTLGPIMEGFSDSFHEPFYRDYMQDSLRDRMEKSGFEVVSEETHYMSKYVTGRKN
jgi:ubiquinone/menaquinone biosynthesis C-methylase UbiE